MICFLDVAIISVSNFIQIFIFLFLKKCLKHEDDAFLLGFLRYAHYDHSVAQKRIDNFCSVRCLSKHGITEWYKYPKLTDPIVDIYLDAG